MQMESPVATTDFLLVWDHWSVEPPHRHRTFPRVGVGHR